MFTDGRGHGEENGIFLNGRELGEFVGGGARLAAHLVDGFLDGGHGCGFRGGLWRWALEDEIVGWVEQSFVQV